MICDVILAIAAALRKEFGGEYKIYADNIEQGLQEPCFLITHLTTNAVYFLNTRRDNRCAFDVHYFSKTRDSRGVADVEFRLQNCLRLITSSEGNGYLGTNMHTEKQDGVLHFFVNYNFVTRTADQTGNEMTEVDITQGLEGIHGNGKN